MSTACHHLAIDFDRASSHCFERRKKLARGTAKLRSIWYAVIYNLLGITRDWCLRPTGVPNYSQFSPRINNRENPSHKQTYFHGRLRWIILD